MNDRDRTLQPASLQLVAATREDVRRHVWFCDACAAHGESGAVPPPFDRRCRACGAGQLLEALETLAPRAGVAFLTFDDRLVVTSVSDAAAELLASAADDVVGRPVDALLAVPDTSGGEVLGRRLLDALASGGDGELTARPVGTFGVRLRLRAGVCGPPRRGLVVFDCSGASRAGAGERPARERRGGPDAGGRRRWWSREGRA